jgi:hypothetical protein
MRVCFILGAGYSQSLGMPGTDELTELVMHRMGESLTEFGMPPFIYELDKKQLLLEVLKDHITDSRYHASTSPSYEDLYEAIELLSAYLYGWYYHPLFRAFTERILSDSRLNGICIDARSRLDSFKFLIDGLQRDIPKSIAEYLKHRQDLISNPVIPRILNECIDDTSCDRVDVITLNYDMLVELALTHRAILYSRGFTKDMAGISTLFPGEISFGDKKVRICKLHGSLDWYTPFSGVNVPHVEEGRTRSIQGDPPVIYYEYPTILLGRDHKMRAYGLGEFGDLQYYYRNTVRETDSLVIIGFSGRDFTVARILEGWLMENEKRLLWIIDPNGDEVKQRIVRSADIPSIGDRVKIHNDLHTAKWSEIAGK